MGIIAKAMQRVFGGTAPAPAPTAFDISQNQRRLAAIPSTSMALNSLIAMYGATAVARSRYLCVNNPYAAAAKETFVAALVGPTGIRPSTLGERPAVKSKVHEDWAHWCETSDMDGVVGLAGQQGVVASELFEAGEVFAQFITPRNTEEGNVPLRIKIIPSEMLPFDNASALPVEAGNFIHMGIEYTPEGERVAYHFLANHPSDVTKSDSTRGRIRVPASEVMHVYRPIRAGQVRGIPATLSALLSTAMLDLYDDAELERKRVAALFAAFVTKRDPEEADSPLGNAISLQSGGSASVSGSASDDNAFVLKPGVVVDLLPGEDVKFSSPADVGNSYDPFQYRMLCRLAAGFGVPYASMSGDLKAANYGSIRAGLVQFRRRIEMWQYQNFIPMFLRRVWLRWLKVYTIAGLSPWTASDWVRNRRKHERVKWLCPRWEWVDPLKDMQAEKLAVDNGFKARHDTIEEIGDDPDETDTRILESQDSVERLGIILNTGAEPVADGDPDNADPPSTKEKPDAE